MRRPHASQMSILCLTWINQELRKEIERREQAHTRRSIFTPNIIGTMSRTTTFLVAGLSGCWAAWIRFLDAA